MSNATKNFYYSTIADRLRVVSSGNDCLSTDVIKLINGIQNFPLTAKAVKSKGNTFENVKIILMKTENKQPTKAERK